MLISCVGDGKLALFLCMALSTVPLTEMSKSSQSYGQLWRDNVRITNFLSRNPSYTAVSMDNKHDARFSCPGSVHINADFTVTLSSSRSCTAAVRKYLCEHNQTGLDLIVLDYNFAPVGFTLPCFLSNFHIIIADECSA